MPVIAIFNQKGGSGKSMLTVNLAVTAHQAKRRVAVLDMDTDQGSAMVWHEARRGKPGPAVIVVPDGSLQRALAAAQADGFDWVLLDAPPSVSPTTASIIAAADLVVIPIIPQPFDIAAVARTLKLIGSKPHVFVLSNCPQKAPENREMAASLKAHGHKVVGQVNNWRSLWRALVTGEAAAEIDPKGEPAAEYKTIFKAIQKELKS